MEEFYPTGWISFQDEYGKAMIKERFLGIGFSYYKPGYNGYLKESILQPDNSVVMTEKLTDEKLEDYATKTNVYTKGEVEAKIVELAPPPGNYNAVSNRAMGAVSESRATAIAEDVVASRPILLADTKTNLVYILKADDGLGDGGFYFYAYTNDTSVVNK